jgi:DNA-binding response OmpR family regulator
MYHRVVVVEDEAIFRGVIARNLRGRGVTVQEAESVREGIDEVLAEAPDLMLLDVNLPDGSGWDVLRELRRRGIEVPTIVISAVHVGQSRLEEFKPLAYLPKPFPIEALLRLVVDATEEGAAASQSPEGDGQRRREEHG